MKEEFLTTPELCELLKVNRTTVWRWREKGMPYLGSGKTIRYDKNEVLQWLKNQNQETNQGYCRRSGPSRTTGAFRSGKERTIQ